MLFQSVLLIQGLFFLAYVSAVPTSPPTITSTEAINPRSLRVNWTQVDGSSGYRIELYQSSSLNQPIQVHTVEFEEARTLSFTFTGIVPFNYFSSNGISFSTRVAGLDASKSPGPWSQFFTGVLPMCPGQCNYLNQQHFGSGCGGDGDVQCVCNPAYRGASCTEPTFVPRMVELEPSRITSLTHYELQVTWEPPDLFLLDGRLVANFGVRLIEVVNGSTTRIHTNDQIPANNTSYILTNLQSGGDYQVEVATISDVPEEQPAIAFRSISFVIRTPGPVESLSTTTTVSTLTVSWAPPNGSSEYPSLLQIRDYRVKLERESGVVVTETVVMPTALQIIYADLLPGTSYTVLINARNEVGEGEVVSTVIVTPPTMCPINHYGLPNGTLSMCTSCPANSQSPAGSLSVSNCTCVQGYEQTVDTSGTFTCTMSTCPPLSVAGGLVSYSQKDLVSGTVARYVCNQTFTLSGAVSRTCVTDSITGSGGLMWNGESPSCVVTVCNQLSTSGLEGSIVYTDSGTVVTEYTFGIVATYQCEPGYQASGSGTRTCVDGSDGTGIGSWSGAPVTCERVLLCPALPTVSRGEVMYSGDSMGNYSLGTMATYSCFTGHALNGSSTRMCVEQSGAAVWNGTAPTCVSTVFCSPLDPLNNQAITYIGDTTPNYDLHTVATFTCDEGYVLSPNISLTCMFFFGVAAWGGNPPACRRVLLCPALPTVSQGEVMYSGDSMGNYSLGTMATYSCFFGYALNGSSTRTCVEQSGATVWNGMAPTCVSAVFCLPLDPLNNGAIMYIGDTTPNYDLNTVATFSCDEGYVLSPNISLTCIPFFGEAIWGGNPPACRRACSPLPMIDFGTITYSVSTLVVGTVANYTCDDGSSITRVCLSVGMWSGLEPMCGVITCPNLIIPSNGSLVYTAPEGSNIPGIERGTIAAYKCNAGFRLNGTVTRECGLDQATLQGVWNGMDPQCVACLMGEYLPQSSSSQECLQCGPLHTTTTEAATACDTCLYSTPTPDGLCYYFDDDVQFLEPLMEDVFIDTSTNRVRLTLRWPLLPTNVRDVNNNTVAVTRGVRIFCGVESGYTDSSFCRPDNNPLLIQINSASSSLYTALLSELTLYNFRIAITAVFTVGSSEVLRVGRTTSLTFISPALATNDSRLPQITLVSASPSGYQVHYQMDEQLPPLVRSINTVYGNTSGGFTFKGVALVRESEDLPRVGSVMAAMLLPVGEAVWFRLETESGLFTYSSPTYTLNATRNNLPAPVIDEGQSRVLNSTAVEVSWNAVSGASTYTVAVSGSGLTRVLIRTSNTQLVVTNLRPGTMYSITVVAEDANSLPGHISSSFTVTTGEALPGPPQSVVVSVEGSFIIINWQPPEFPNGVITQYNVMLTLATGTSVFATDELFLRVPKPDSAYSISVQAVNSVGKGEVVFAEDPTGVPSTLLSLEIIIVIAVVGTVVVLMGLLLCVCCCCYCRRSKKAFKVRSDFTVRNPQFVGVDGNVLQLQQLHSKRSDHYIKSSSLAPLVPSERYNSSDVEEGGEGTMYAEVNEMQRMKATQSIREEPPPLPLLHERLPKRDATPDDYNNEELYMEMGKIYYADVNQINIFSPYEVDRGAITILSDLGQGQFGQVSKAKMKNVLPGRSESFVAVKMLKKEASDNARKDFLGEAQMLASFNHSNVMGLLKVVTRSEPVLVVIPFMTNGDLKNYLKNQRKMSSSSLNSNVVKFGVLDQVYIAEQIAAGMEYLAAKFFIHRDLAARNILVGENNHCKIADFGLSRALAKEDTYYHVSNASLLPIKWMAIESVLYRKFSTYSDVWSFGIVLWEIFSFGAGPYKGISAANIPNHIQKGKRLECPEKCPNEVYEIMTRCWNSQKEKRSTFSQLKLRLKAIGIELRRTTDKNNSLEVSAEDNYI